MKTFFLMQWMDRIDHTVCYGIWFFLNELDGWWVVYSVILGIFLYVKEISGTPFFLCKNTVYKNIEGSKSLKIKNILRIRLRLKSHRYIRFFVKLHSFHLRVRHRVQHSDRANWDVQYIHVRLYYRYVTYILPPPIMYVNGVNHMTK